MLAKFTALPPATKMKLGIGLAALLAAVVAMALWARQGDYRVLYANLPDKDGGAVVAQLSQMNVPYRFTEGGGAILVPADRVLRPAHEAGRRRPAQGRRGHRLRAAGQRTASARPRARSA